MIREYRSVLRLTLTMLLASAGSVQAEEGEAFTVPLVPQSSGAFYIKGTLGGVITADFLVDTGSSYVVLSKRTFDALAKTNRTTYLRSIRGATANGRTVKAKVYEVSELSIGEDCVLEAVEVVVLPGSDRDILGLSALRRVEPFTFNLTPLTLNFGACRGPVEESLQAAN